MASANLDLVRSIYADWERGDFSSAAWADPEIEFVRADGPSPGKWTGLAGMAEGTRDWLNTWENARAEVDEYRELDAERVLVLVSYTGRGKVSGVEIGELESKGAQLFHLEGGKVIRFVHYLRRERALADLGLKEKPVSANLELVRSIYAAWERGDFTQTIDWAAPEIEFVIVDGPMPGSWRGLAGMREAWREYIGAWENYRFIVDEVRELDDERVLALYHRSGRGKTSGLELGQIQSEGANVFHVRDGKVTRIVRYWDPNRALADLGVAG